MKSRAELHSVRERFILVTLSTNERIVGLLVDSMLTQIKVKHQNIKFLNQEFEDVPI